MKITELTFFNKLNEDRAPKMKAVDASLHYEKLKKMFDAGNPSITQRMLDGSKANADSLWDSELKAKEQHIISKHGNEWWELVKKQYPIINSGNSWVVTSTVKKWADNKEWEFEHKSQAVEKVLKLVAWVYQNRKRGFGDMDSDIQKWLDKLTSADKSSEQND